LYQVAQGEHVIAGTKRVKYPEDNAGSVHVTVTAESQKKIDALLQKYPATGPRYGANENKFVKK
jgi:aryl-alcohol dehydrogenase-like predicted oxidoreductase